MRNLNVDYVYYVMKQQIQQIQKQQVQVQVQVSCRRRRRRRLRPRFVMLLWKNLILEWDTDMHYVMHCTIVSKRRMLS